MKVIFVFLLVLMFGFLQAQNRQTDSLLDIVNSKEKVAYRAEALFSLFDLNKKNDLPKASDYVKQALNLSIKAKYKKGIAESHNRIGLAYKYNADYHKSIEEFNKAIIIFGEINDQRGLAKSFNNIALSLTRLGKFDEALNNHRQAYQIRVKIKDSLAIAASLHNFGLVHELIGNYLRALNYYQQAYQLKLKLGDEKSAGITLGNIGNIYVYENDYENAIDYYRKSLKSRLKYNNQRGAAIIISNIGVVFKELGKIDSSLAYYQKALALNNELENKEGMANQLGNIGAIYIKKREYKKAEKYLKESFDMAKSINNHTLICNALANLGGLFIETKNYDLAIQYLEESFDLALELGDKRMKQSIYESYVKLYAEKGDYQKAYEYSNKFNALKDTLESAEIKKLQTKFNNAEQDREIELQEKHIKLLEKDKTIANTNQKMLLLGIAFILFIVIISTIFIIYRFNIKQKVLETTLAQKKVIDEKNKDITDSISYASKIQNAIMPGAESFLENFENTFGIILPKDIVSGDFCWTYSKGIYKYIATVDCTGHGVPGAFMSMLGVTFLNQIVEKSKDTEPGSILNQLHIKITKALKQTTETDSNKDGMDIALCRISEKGVLEFAGAYNPLIVVRNKELIEIKADRFSIGGGMPEEKKFKTHKLDIKRGSWCYLFSDGFQDQFGGPDTKKFTIKRLRELLLEINSKNNAEQYKIVKDTFVNWKGSEKQTDDVTFVAFQV